MSSLKTTANTTPMTSMMIADATPADTRTGQAASSLGTTSRASAASFPNSERSSFGVVTDSPAPAVARTISAAPDVRCSGVTPAATPAFPAKTAASARPRRLSLVEDGPLISSWMRSGVTVLVRWKVPSPLSPSMGSPLLAAARAVSAASDGNAPA